MPKLATPLTDTAVKNAKPKDKTYTLGDGGGMYLEVTPTGAKFWRMAYRQPNGKNNRLTFGTYPEVTLAVARERRLAARRLLDRGIDPGQDKKERQREQGEANANTFEKLARDWLTKTAVARASSTQDKNTAWLERNVFPQIGAMPITTQCPLLLSNQGTFWLHYARSRRAALSSRRTRSSSYVDRYSGSLSPPG
jgi:hypothetical protein